VSPHAGTDLVLSSNCLLDVSAGLKLITGSQNPAGWAANLFPNNTSAEGDVSFSVDCAQGCLFNVTADPNEHDNLALSQVAVNS